MGAEPLAAIYDLLPRLCDCRLPGGSAFPSAGGASMSGLVEIGLETRVGTIWLSRSKIRF